MGAQRNDRSWPRAEGLVFGRENVVSDVHFGSPRFAEDPFARSAPAALRQEQTLLRICRQIGPFVRHSPAVIYTSRRMDRGALLSSMCARQLSRDLDKPCKCGMVFARAPHEFQRQL